MPNGSSFFLDVMRQASEVPGVDVGDVDRAFKDLYPDISAQAAVRVARAALRARRTFEFEVDYDADAPKKWADCELIGRPLRGKRRIRMRLIELVFGPSKKYPEFTGRRKQVPLDYAAAWLRRKGHRPLSGQAAPAFLRAFPYATDTDQIAFLGAKWRDSGGDERALETCRMTASHQFATNHDQPGPLLTHQIWFPSADFDTTCLYAVEDK